ncbi:hypothetical protein [Thiolinea disciformis]|uniref:hypothetical protein n=1 Tax=Thiolinea disciformis TaxID=125614 RepID=UPI000366518A|nr:hypothetical protein [Thiolinea disciformis]
MAHTPTPDIQQQRLTMLTQKLAKLYKQYDLETDATRKFQLEHLIKETEAEIQGMHHISALSHDGQTSKHLPYQGMTSTMKVGLIGALVVTGIVISFIFMSTTNNIKGNCSGDLSDVKGNVQISCYNQGETPEEKQQKIQQAKQAVGNEIINNLLALDSRLGYIAQALGQDNLSTNLDQVNKEIVPAAAKYFKNGITNLLAQTSITSLRQTMNSSPLRSDFGTALTQTLINTGTDVTNIRQFYDQLKNIELKTENLFGDLAQIANHRVSNNPQEMDFYQNNLENTIKSLKIYTELTYYIGLETLTDLNLSKENINTQLSALLLLQPKKIPTKAILHQLKIQKLTELEKLIQKKQDANTSGEEGFNQRLNELKELVAQLDIKPEDKPEDLFWKAATLRKLGQTNKAKSTLDYVKKHFPNLDKFTQQYLDTAYYFTEQASAFGVEGGLYVVDTSQSTQASKIGLTNGDIVLTYNKKPLLVLQDILDAQQELGQTASIKITFLHIHKDTHKFELREAIVLAGKLGVMFKPI